MPVECFDGLAVVILQGFLGCVEAMDEACCVVLTVTEAVYGVTASTTVLNCTVLLQKKGQTVGRSPQQGAAGAAAPGRS